MIENRETNASVDADVDAKNEVENIPPWSSPLIVMKIKKLIRLLLLLTLL